MMNKSALKKYYKENEAKIKAMELTIEELRFRIHELKVDNIRYETEIAKHDLGFGQDDKILVNDKKFNESYKMIINNISIDDNTYWISGDELEEHGWRTNRRICSYNPNNNEVEITVEK